MTNISSVDVMVQLPYKKIYTNVYREVLIRIIIWISKS